MYCSFVRVFSTPPSLKGALTTPPLQLFYLDNTKKREHISDLTDKMKRRGLERSREALARRVNCSKILPVALSGPQWALWGKMVNCPLDPVVRLQVARTEASWSTFFEHMVNRRVDWGAFRVAH